MADDGLIREVDEAYKQDQLRIFLEKYGKTLGVIAGLLVVVLAAYLIWHQQELATRNKVSDALWQANRLLDKGDDASVENTDAILKEVEPDAGKLGALVQLKLAELYTKTGEQEKLVEALSKASSFDSPEGAYACSLLVTQAGQESAPCVQKSGVFEPYIAEVQATKLAAENPDKAIEILPSQPATVMQQNRIDPLMGYLKSARGEE